MGRVGSCGDPESGGGASVAVASDTVISALSEKFPYEIYQYDIFE